MRYRVVFERDRLKHYASLEENYGTDDNEGDDWEKVRASCEQNAYDALSKLKEYIVQDHEERLRAFDIALSRLRN